jgi:hypothetical protein
MEADMTVKQNLIAGKALNIQTAIAQIESCGFECEAGPLPMNTAWIWLKSLAQGPRYQMGQSVPHIITAEASGFDLSRTVLLTIVGVKMSSGTDGLLWVYDLSKDPPAAYHYGSGVTVANVAQQTIDHAIAACED